MIILYILLFLILFNIGLVIIGYLVHKGQVIDNLKDFKDK